MSKRERLLVPRTCLFVGVVTKVVCLGAILGGGGNRTTAGGAGGNAKKKCKYCGRPHLDKVPEELCYEREENTFEVPDWYKQVTARLEAKAAAKK